jgi:hypothetical protein
VFFENQNHQSKPGWRRCGDPWPQMRLRLRVAGFWVRVANVFRRKSKKRQTSVEVTNIQTYFKVGFDYNSFENWLDMENMIYVGMRYGVSSFSHTLNTYKIYDPTNYYGETIITSGAKFDNLNASWVEVIGGIKAELFNNLYLGFSVRLNYLVSNKKPADFDNLFIPGYNRTYDGKFGAGFNYTLSYFIPIYKKKKELATTTK